MRSGLGEAAQKSDGGDRALNRAGAVAWLLATRVSLFNYYSHGATPEEPRPLRSP